MSAPTQQPPAETPPPMEKKVDSSDNAEVSPTISNDGEEGESKPKGSIGQRMWRNFKTPGSALQIVVAAALAIAIGLAVSSTVHEVPAAARVIISIPGDLWLRSLKAVVLPLIVTAMILAVQKLRQMTQGGGGRLAKWTILYYVLTTLWAIIISTILTSQVWAKQFTEVSGDDQSLDNIDEADEAKTEEQEIHDVVLQMFQSLIPSNVVNALATDSLLAVLIMSIVVGYLIEGPNSAILKVTIEVEKIITKIITFLIKLAPIGVFFLILPNLFKLDITEIGENLGYLIGGSLSGMAIHLFISLPIIFFAFTRMNPYTYWFQNSPAWLTAWGTASSAATLSVTLKCAKARGIPNAVAKFAIPLGALINMDGTAIYFPVVVVFMAATQGISLNAADYIIVILLSTLASIGTTPIPSSSLVLTVMIAASVNVPLTGMYAVVIAIDWFIDRFRTATNVSGDLFAAKVVAKMTGITDPDDMSDEEVGEITTTRNDERV